MRAIVACAYEAVTALVPFGVASAVLARKRKVAKKNVRAGQSAAPRHFSTNASAVSAVSLRRLSIAHDLVAIAFAVCLFLVLWITGVGTLADLLRGGYPLSGGQVNLVAFRPSMSWSSWLLNLVLFAPIGFLLPCGWRGFNRMSRSLAFGFGLSLAIELSQMLNFRITDVDDLVANTLGTLLGLLVYRALHRLRPRWFPGGEGLRPAREVVICSVAMCAGVFCLFASSRHAEMRVVNFLNRL